MWSLRLILRFLQVIAVRVSVIGHRPIVAETPNK
jgi:hypothetical protein